MMITIMMFRKTRKIISIIIIMIIRNQKSILSTRHLLLNIHIIIIKKFTNFAISFFNILNKLLKEIFERNFKENSKLVIDYFFKN